MAHRTTIVLDEQSKRAAHELAAEYECSVSEAIRRAIIEQRSRTFGVSEQRRQQRLEAFARLVELFEGHDAEAELARLKAEDDHL